MRSATTKTIALLAAALWIAAPCPAVTINEVVGQISPNS